MRCVARAAVVLAVAAPTADAALDFDILILIHGSGPAEVDLDGDAVNERVLIARHPTDKHLRRAVLERQCPGGRALEQVIGPYRGRVEVRTIRVRHSGGPPLLAVDGSTGIRGRRRVYWAHRLGPEKSSAGCSVLHTVFRFPHRTAPVPKPPPGTTARIWFASPREVRGKVWFQTHEGLYRSRDRRSSPTHERTIDWKPRGNGYVIANVRVRRYVPGTAEPL